MRVLLHIIKILIPSFSFTSLYFSENGIEKLKKFAYENNAKIISEYDDDFEFYLVKNISNLKLSGRYKVIALITEQNELSVEIRFLSELFFYLVFLVFSFFIILSMYIKSGFSSDIFYLFLMCFLSGHLMKPMSKIFQWKKILAELGFRAIRGHGL